MFNYRKNLLKFTFLFIILILTNCFWCAAKFKNNTWFVRFVRVVDKELPMISKDELNISLKEAKRLAELKFKTKIEFVDKGSLSVKEFFEKNRKLNPKGFAYLDKEDINIFDENISETDKNTALERLEILFPDIEHLRSFFPEETKKRIHTYTNILDEVIYPFKETKKAIKDIKNDKNSPYFKKETQSFYSSAYWGIAIEKEKDYDLIITNCPMVMDKSGLKVIHVSSYKGVVHGQSATINLPYRDTGPFVVSTFPLYVENDFFKKKSGNLSKKEKPLVLGEFILHELGHSLFYMKDDIKYKNEGCIMQRDYLTLNDKIRYELVKKKEPCPQEIDMVKLTEAVVKYRSGDKELARKGVKEVDEKFSDNYEIYDIFFLYNVAVAYIEIGMKKDAVKVFKKMLKLPLRKGRKEMIKDDIKYFEK